MILSKGINIGLFSEIDATISMHFWLFGAFPTNHLSCLPLDILSELEKLLTNVSVGYVLAAAPCVLSISGYETYAWAIPYSLGRSIQEK